MKYNQNIKVVYNTVRVVLQIIRRNNELFSRFQGDKDLATFTKLKLCL